MARRRRPSCCNDSASYTRRSPIRPTRLELEGFTSFRDPAEVDFSRLDLFAITGPTGAGKTSLLDAITYALYGRTTRMGKSARELVSQGATRMSVCLEFRAGTELYRVLRILDKRAATVRLERSMVQGLWEPVASKVKDIEQAILHAVGLDFEGFTKAVILPQGEFDAFLRGDKTTRRGILADLLEIRVYDEMKTRANERAKDQAKEADWNRRHINADATEGLCLELAERIKGLEAEGSVLSRGLDRLHKALPVAIRLGQAEDRYRVARAEEQAGLRAIPETAEKLRRLESDHSAGTELLRELVLQEEHSGYDPELHLRLQGWLPLVRRREELERQVAATRSALDAAEVESGRLQARIAAANHSVEEAAAAGAEASRRIQELEEVRLHACDVASLRRHLKPGERCPVCERVVLEVPEAEGSAVSATKVEEQVAEALRKQMAQGMEKAKELAQEARHALQLFLQEQDQRRRSLETSLAEMDGMREPLRDTPAGVDVGLRQQEELRRKSRQFIRKVQQQRSAMEQLEVELATTRTRQAVLSERADQMGKLSQEAASAVEAARRSWKTVSDGLDCKGDYAEQIEKRRQILARQLDQQRAELAAASTRLDALTFQVAENARLAGLSEQQEHSASLYAELGTLLNAANFQQFLLSESVERLAKEGSEQLMSLSGARYSFQASKDDFLIIDHWNAAEPRSANTLSGGESFIASLSLSLALAGSICDLNGQKGTAMLESLFLDEGFSTLDTETLAKVSDAVQLLENGGRLVGIITHIAALAEQLPARVEVDKTVGGSRVWVVGGTARTSVASS
ncbi:MAG: SMC family ATPase [Acidobacteriia bacterium]|nr:SMC family ATPase [Terriglobia bacterium]